MIDLSDVVNDPDFAEDFTILRTLGAFEKGKWTSAAPLSVPFYGIIQPANSDELQQLPEGDRVTGSISVYSSQQMFITNAAGTSDIVQWRGQRWRLAKVDEWADFGYWYGLAVRMSGV